MMYVREQIDAFYDMLDLNYNQMMPLLERTMAHLDKVISERDQWYEVQRGIIQTDYNSLKEYMSLIDAEYDQGEEINKEHFEQLCDEMDILLGRTADHLEELLLRYRKERIQ